MPVELKIPQVGESITEVQIGKWLKSKGERVEKDEALVEIETDKVNVELPAPASGTITEVLKQTGEAASVGEVIGYLDSGNGGGDGGGAPAKAEPEKATQAAPKEPAQAKEPAAAQKPAPEAKETKSAPAKESTAPAAAAPKPATAPPKPAAAPAKPAAEPAEPVAPPTPAGGDRKRPTPTARRALVEHGLEPEEVPASGPAGRLLKEDVLRHLEQQGTVMQPSPAASRQEEAVPMSPMRRRIAERLVQAQQAAALLSSFNEIDMSAVVRLRQEVGESFQARHGIKLGFMSFFVKASIEALKVIPQLNAEIRGNDILYRNYYDIGIAVSTERGLVVPVLRNAERMSFAQIEAAIAEFAGRAREGKIKLEELEGGTFTITNGGVYGSLLSTPIVNPPQSGILGMHAIQERPVVREGQVVIRPMMYVALTYDHRIIDGREAVTFLIRLKEVIEDPARMLLET